MVGHVPSGPGPNYVQAHYGKGATLWGLKRYEEALVAFDQALRLKPNLAETYYDNCAVLRDLNRYEEALAALRHHMHLLSAADFQAADVVYKRDIFAIYAGVK